jgi:hypothetical protein
MDRVQLLSSIPSANNSAGALLMRSFFRACSPQQYSEVRLWLPGLSTDQAESLRSPLLLWSAALLQLDASLMSLAYIVDAPRLVSPSAPAGSLSPTLNPAGSAGTQAVLSINTVAPASGSGGQVVLPTLAGSAPTVTQSLDATVLARQLANDLSLQLSQRSASAGNNTSNALAALLPLDTRVTACDGSCGGVSAALSLRPSSAWALALVGLLYLLAMA